MMGWMHDSLDYFKKDPIYRKHHHSELTFSMVYGFTENYVKVKTPWNPELFNTLQEVVLTHIDEDGTVRVEFLKKEIIL